jgi:uncharacterized protein YcbK (DUF882 family)
MPRVEVSVDKQTKAAFKTLAKQSCMTEAAYLRRMIATVVRSNSLDLAEDGPGSRRTKRIFVRVTPDVFDALTTVARAAGTSRPGIVLATLRARFTNAPTLLPTEAEEVTNAAFQLAMVGANLNQLTRAMHQGRTEELHELGPVLSEIAKAIDGLRQHTRLLMETTTTRWAPRGGWE